MLLIPLAAEFECFTADRATFKFSVETDRSGFAIRLANHSNETESQLQVAASSLAGKQGVIPVAKPLCEMKKLVKTDFKQFLQYVSNPTHACRKCGRAANCKRRLCKPVRLQSGDPR